MAALSARSDVTCMFSVQKLGNLLLSHARGNISPVYMIVISCLPVFLTSHSM